MRQASRPVQMQACSPVQDGCISRPEASSMWRLCWLCARILPYTIDRRPKFPSLVSVLISCHYDDSTMVPWCASVRSHCRICIYVLIQLLRGSADTAQM